MSRSRAAEIRNITNQIGHPGNARAQPNLSQTKEKLNSLKKASRNVGVKNSFSENNKQLEHHHFKANNFFQPDHNSASQPSTKGAALLHQQSPVRPKRIYGVGSKGQRSTSNNTGHRPPLLTAQETSNIILESLLDPNEDFYFDPRQVMLPNFEPARHSSKKNGIIRAYAANTNQGIFRYAPAPRVK